LAGLAKFLFAGQMLLNSISLVIVPLSYNKKNMAPFIQLEVNLYSSRYKFPPGKFELKSFTTFYRPNVCIIYSISDIIL